MAEELNARGAAGPDLDPVVVPRVRSPGAGVLEFERDRAPSALLGVRGGGRRYLEVRPDGEWVWPGMCRWTERADSDGVTRTVTTPRETWTETYRWIDHRLVEVDGVEIRRDEKGRVIACVPGGTDPAPAEHRWFYGYSEQGLVHIDRIDP